MTSKRTPGDWLYDVAYGEIKSQSGKIIAILVECDEEGPNARLIAAAPDLLDALEECRDVLVCDCSDMREVSAVRLANAAIAKARERAK
jgi:hypothetical protein